MAQGSTGSPSSMRHLRSQRRSRTWPPRNALRLQHECTNLMWADLVCEGLNDKRKARAQTTIDAELLKETGNTIIDDFYQRCMVDVPDKTRRFIEDFLITEGGFR